MKLPFSLLVLLCLALAGCAQRPRHPGRSNACQEPKSGVRILSASPAVPFAFSSSTGVVPAGKGCCQAFASAAQYHAFDRYGGPLGTFRVAGWEDYDMTHCRELYFTPAAPVGAAFYASAPLPLAARPLVVSSDLLVDIRAALEPVATSYGPKPKNLPDLEPPPDLLEPSHSSTPGERMLAFEWQRAAAWEQYVVVGGEFLAVFRRQSGKLQLVCRVDELTFTGFYWPYRVHGVAQLDDAPDPELLFVESDGPSWRDVILSIGTATCTRRAESVGGSTG
jgi:hypothetical protein